MQLLVLRGASLAQQRVWAIFAEVILAGLVAAQVHVVAELTGVVPLFATRLVRLHISALLVHDLRVPCGPPSARDACLVNRVVSVRCVGVALQRTVLVVSFGGARVVGTQLRFSLKRLRVRLSSNQ